MTEHSVVLKLPAPLYERVRKLAETSNQTVETVLLESLDTLFNQLAPEVDLEIALAALAAYSDSQLWTVVHRQLDSAQSGRLRDLSARSKQGSLSVDEQHELDALLDMVDQQMLLRSEALRLLQQRGYSVEAYLTPSP